MLRVRPMSECREFVENSFGSFLAASDKARKMAKLRGELTEEDGAEPEGDEKVGNRRAQH